MIIERQGVPVIRLQTTGDIALAPFYQDGNVPDPVPVGALAIHRPDGTVLLASRQEAKDSVAAMQTDIAVAGRFCAKAVFPADGGLRIFEPGGTVVARLSEAGDLMVLGQDVSAIPNPGTTGDFAVAPYVYAAPGLIYAGGLSVPYAAFNNIQQIPDSSWQTRTIDLSGVRPSLSQPTDRFGGTHPWPFTIDRTPINGLVRVPRGPGPYPLIVFAHGNHSPLENSTPGYLYLCEALASQGFIAATIDVNFFNGAIHGENAARALVQLEHILQFQQWNRTDGHPLKGKVDLSRIVIAGHSRGGEAVIHASLLNGLDAFMPTLMAPLVALDGTGPRPLGPYRFALKGLIAIAPTDNQYRPVAPMLPPQTMQTVVQGTSYLLIHGTKDADVTSFPGYQAYDRALPYDPTDMRRPASGFKVLHWIYKANHNYFNTEWAYDVTSRKVGPDWVAWPQDIADVMPPVLQRDYARLVIGAWSQIHLRGRSSYWEFLRQPRSANARGWLAENVDIVSQYHDRDRLWIQNFDEIGQLQITRPVTGTVRSAGISTDRRFLAFPMADTPSGFDSTRFLFQHTGGLLVRGAGSMARYQVKDLDFHTETGRFQVLSLRAGQPAIQHQVGGPDQDFNIRFTDRNGVQCTVCASAYGTLPYPGEYSKLRAPPGRVDSCERKMVMQTLRIPLSDLRAKDFDVRAIKSVELLFDVPGTPESLYIDDLQLSL